MNAKAANILKCVATFALVAAVAGSSYILFEAATFPHSSEGVRRTAINVGRRYSVYGTDRESMLNHVSFMMTVTGVIVGVFATAIVARYAPPKNGSNQSTDPTLASGTPGAGHQSRHP